MPRKRHTQQRTVIESILLNTKHPLLPSEILEIARDELPSLGIATVFRALKDLLSEEIVRKVSIGTDAVRYEGKRDHHHHFKCVDCDNVFDLHSCPGNMEKLLPPGFELIDHDITLFGRCASCGKEAGKQC